MGKGKYRRTVMSPQRNHYPTLAECASSGHVFGIRSPLEPVRIKNDSFDVINHECKKAICVR